MLSVPPPPTTILSDPNSGAPIPIWLNWFNAIFRFVRGASQVSSGIIAPISMPNKIGDIYVDTVLLKIYVATGVTSSSDWTIIN